MGTGDEGRRAAIVPFGDRVARWEMALVLLAAGAHFALASANLGVPALWHDELMHVYVGKSIAETGRPRLPAGTPYFSGTTFNYVMALVVRLWGTSEAAVRMPSVLFGTANVVLAYWVARRLLGRPAALVTAFALALSPWTVAWSREARFYALQQSFYLMVVLAFMELLRREHPKPAWPWAALGIGAYVLGVLTSYHSMLFLGAIGAWCGLMLFYDSGNRLRWAAGAVIVAALGLATIGLLSELMNPLDRETVLDRGGLGGELIDPERSTRGYYTLWLRQNLSLGYYLLALFGFAAMVTREGRRGLVIALAFWVPIVVLSYFIGYRRDRFMYFAFPFYVMAFSYAFVVAAKWLRRPKTTWPGRIAALAVLVFAARLGVSTARLVGDSLEAAGGAHTTLATRHPQWKQPCAYVKGRLDGAVVLTTTYLPVLHYVGRVDNWYPSRFLWWEKDESGMEGLKDLDALKAFLAAHPKGFYLAEWWRFHRNEHLMPEEIAWVNGNTRLIEEASSEDVRVYAWGE